MANNKNLAQDGKRTRFSKENQPENRGRRPSVLAKYIRENRVSLADIQALISSLIGCTADEIKTILRDKTDKPPVGIICMLKALTADMETGSIGNLMTLMDRAYGKPEKTVNHEIGAIPPETIAALNFIFTEKAETQKHGRKPRAKQ